MTGCKRAKVLRNGRCACLALFSRKKQRSFSRHFSLYIEGARVVRCCARSISLAGIWAMWINFRETAFPRRARQKSERGFRCLSDILASEGVIHARTVAHASEGRGESGKVKGLHRPVDEVVHTPAGLPDLDDPPLLLGLERHLDHLVHLPHALHPDHDRAHDIVSR